MCIQIQVIYSYNSYVSDTGILAKHYTECFKSRFSFSSTCFVFHDVKLQEWADKNAHVIGNMAKLSEELF